MHVSQTLFEDALQDQMKRVACGFGWRNWLVNVRELTKVAYEIMSRQFNFNTNLLVKVTHLTFSSVVSL